MVILLMVGLRCFFEDLTPEAQKEYLKFMKVKSEKELNMDMPGVFPITIIEY